MTKNYYQDGTTMDWYNGTGSAVVSGQPVVVGSIIGIAQHDIADGREGVLMMPGGSFCRRLHPRPGNAVRVSTCLRPGN
ncbi:capsid cement protein [Citrobacter freundii]